MAGRLFISYASEDAAIADTIRTGLEQAGVPCWIAPRDIEPGTSFPAAITAAIQSCSAQVLLLTVQANTSRHVLSEVELAFNAGKPILAVLVGKVTPSADLQYFISTTHWFDAEATFDDADLSRLKTDIEKLLAGERVRLDEQRGRRRRRTALIAAAVATVALIALIVSVMRFSRAPQPAAPAPAATPSATQPSLPQPSAPATTPPSTTTVAPATPAPLPTPSVRSKINSADGQVYVWIPPGSFAMGCSSGDGDCDPDELPVHTVRIRRGFWLAHTEVTNAQWAKRMKPTPKLERAGTPNHPVVGMERVEAKQYCAAIGGRLPTESEWEYAARAGSRERFYDTLSQIAWFEDDSDDSPHPVGQKMPNAFGLYDMLGNVSEWVLDRYYNKYDDTTDEIEEPIPPNSSAVTRGGAWHSAAKGVRVSNRIAVERDYADYDTGFRCAIDDK
jgi:formylglycine-generating enzyme required for sulfatase activity